MWPSSGGSCVAFGISRQNWILLLCCMVPQIYEAGPTESLPANVFRIRLRGLKVASVFNHSSAVAVLLFSTGLEEWKRTIRLQKQHCNVYHQVWNQKYRAILAQQAWSTKVLVAWTAGILKQVRWRFINKSWNNWNLKKKIKPELPGWKIKNMRKSYSL